MPRRATFLRPEAAHNPAMPAVHVSRVRQCVHPDNPEPPNDRDGDEEDDEEDEFVPPELDDPRRWDDFGADLDDDEEPQPERGDFYTDEDPPRE